MTLPRTVMTAALLALGPAALAQGTPAAPPAMPPSAAPGPGTPVPTAAERAALTRGRALLQEFYAVKLDGLWTAFTPDLQAQWGTLGTFRAFRETGVRQYGQETRVVEERTLTRGTEVFYLRSAVFELAPRQVWGLALGFTGGRVSTFAITLLEDRTGDQVALARPAR